MTDKIDALQEWELEDDYLRQNCEPSYLTHPLWLEHQKKRVVLEAGEMWEELVEARETADDGAR